MSRCIHEVVVDHGFSIEVFSRLSILNDPQQVLEKFKCRPGTVKRSYPAAIT